MLNSVAAKLVLAIEWALDSESEQPTAVYSKLGNTEMSSQRDTRERDA
jgi:hypothetical protein